MHYNWGEAILKAPETTWKASEVFPDEVERLVTISIQVANLPTADVDRLGRYAALGKPVSIVLDSAQEEMQIPWISTETINAGLADPAHALPINPPAENGTQHGLSTEAVDHVARLKLAADESGLEAEDAAYGAAMEKLQDQYTGDRPLTVDSMVRRRVESLREQAQGARE